MIDLNDFGWNGALAEAFEALRGQGLVPARVIKQSRDLSTLVTAEGECDGEVSGKFRHEALGPADFPAVGDWAAVRTVAGGRAQLPVDEGHYSVRCPGSPIVSGLGMAAGIDSAEGAGGEISPAANTSSMTGMIRASRLVARNASRHANRTARSGSAGAVAAIRNAAGTTVSNLNKSATS